MSLTDQRKLELRHLAAAVEPRLNCLIPAGDVLALLDEIERFTLALERALLEHRGTVR